jgi:hypothetical protein
MKKRLGAAVVWFAPLLFLGWRYHASFRIWFREDDFPLLAFVRQAHGFHGFLTTMFAPYAQGTIRPWSERLPFLLSYRLFGYDCAPFRIAVFITAAADMLLIGWMARRITRSTAAGFAAPVFWATGAWLVSPMTWNSSYNEVQYPLFLMGALALLIRYYDTGARRYWWLQVAVFVAGFGSLENNIVYPAIATSWVLFVAEPGRRRKRLTELIPLYGVSAVFAILHFRYARLPAKGLYALAADSRIAGTLWQYWRWAFLSPGWTDLGYPRAPGTGILTGTMVPLILFVAWQLRRRRTGALFCLAWFGIVLSPMLLLPDRHSEYYLAGPAIGLAILGAWGAAAAWNAGYVYGALAMLPVAAWFTGMLPVVRAETRDYVEQSRLSRGLVLGAEAARATHPGKAILLEGMTDELYQIAIRESGFEAIGVDNVYLTADPETTIDSAALLDEAVMFHALAERQAVVYSFAGDHLRNITPVYSLRRFAYPDALPRKVETASPLYAYLLGPEWMGSINGVRWMPGKASLKIGAPAAAGARLKITGYCPNSAVRGTSHRLKVFANGIPLGESEIGPAGTGFQTEFALPDAVLGRSLMEITLEASPVTRAGSQEFSVLIGEIALEDAPATLHSPPR